MGESHDGDHGVAARTRGMHTAVSDPEVVEVVAFPPAINNGFRFILPHAAGALRMRAEKLYASLSEFFKYLYGNKPASFKRYRVVLRQCIAVMWVHLNELRSDQHRFKKKMKEDHQRVEKLLRARRIKQ